MRSPLALLQLLPVPPALGLHGAVAVDKQEPCAVRVVRGSCIAAKRTWAHWHACARARKVDGCT